VAATKAEAAAEIIGTPLARQSAQVARRRASEALAAAQASGDLPTDAQPALVPAATPAPTSAAPSGLGEVPEGIAAARRKLNSNIELMSHPAADAESQSDALANARRAVQDAENTASVLGTENARGWVQQLKDQLAAAEAKVFGRGTAETPASAVSAGDSEYSKPLTYRQAANARVTWNNLMPGTAFGECGEGYVRCSYAYSLDSIEEALSRLRGFIGAIS
jgi:hypothetical protein